MISFSETLDMLYGEPRRQAEREERRKREMAEQQKLTEQLQRIEPPPRPDWDTWFMALAFVVAQRSLDKHTKHGCIIADQPHSILSVGYNSPPRGSIDSSIPLERPLKYLYMEHSESNAIINAARNGTVLRESVFYVTGPPCHDCFRKILNVGASKLVCGPILHQRTQDQLDAISLMNIKRGENFSSCTSQHVEIQDMSDLTPVIDVLSQTIDYIKAKIEEQNAEKEC